MDELMRQRSPNNSWRVKVYLLNLSGNWDDCGTGILEMIKEIENGEELEYFKVTSTEEEQKLSNVSISHEKLNKLKAKEMNSHCILYLPILKRNQFEKQGESIITWTDKEMNEEIALSFLDIIAANETWRNICKRIGSNPNDSKKSVFKDLEKLPMPRIENLEKLRFDMENKKEWMIAAIQKNPKFLDGLMQIFDELEDLDSKEHLMKIYDLVKAMVFTDDISFLELLLSNEYYLFVFGAFEYSPESMTGKKAEHRKFLKESCTFKKVLDINNDSILQKIHLNYRIQYLRDSVISSIIDDQLQNHFQMMIYYNNYEIFQHIINHPTYFKDLFSNFFSNLRNSIGFLTELIQIVKNILQVEAKIGLFDKWLEFGIYDIIGKSLLKIDDEMDITDQIKTTLKINLIEILIFLTQIKINPFISYLKSIDPTKNALHQGLLKCFMYGDQGLQIQISELLKYLLDIMHERRNEASDYALEYFFPELITHFKTLQQNEIYYSFVQQFVDILIYCVKFQGWKIFHFIINKKLLPTLYQVFTLGEKSTSLVIVKLIKAIVISKEDILIKHIVNNNLLDEIFELYLQNANKTNLINSSCLELFEIIRRENIKKLINYIVEHFEPKILKENLTRFFQKLFIKYEQNQESIASFGLEDKPKPEDNFVEKDDFETYGNYTQIERHALEDEEYFESDDKQDDILKIEKGKNSNSVSSASINVNAGIEDEPMKNIENKENKDVEMKPGISNVIHSEGKDNLGVNTSGISITGGNGIGVGTTNANISVPIEEETMKSKRDRLMAMAKKISSKVQENEEPTKSFKNNSSSSRSSSIERMANTISIQLNIQSPALSPSSSQMEMDNNKANNNNNNEDENDVLIKKRNIKTIGKLDNDEEPEIMKKIKLA